MKALMITEEYFINEGGGAYTRSLVSVISEALGYDNVWLFFPYEMHGAYSCPPIHIESTEEKKPKKIHKIINMMYGRPLNISKKRVIELNQIIGREKFDYIIFLRSKYGRVLNHIDIGNSQIITFYHDVLALAIKNRLMNSRITTLVLALPRLISDYKDEKVCLKSSTKNIVLSEREKAVFELYYKKNPDEIIPIFVNDCFDKKKIVPVEKNHYNILFVGSYYWPNLKGIRWFADKVMPYLSPEYTLYIVGNKLEFIREEIESFNIKVIGTVDDLSQWYYDADVVVGPIFDGTGMKVKTVEAIMYGKVYLGTPEALSGYSGLDDYLCMSDKDFIEKIEKYCSTQKTYKYNDYARQIYINNYSRDVIVTKMKQILEINN